MAYRFRYLARDPEVPVLVLSIWKVDVPVPVRRSAYEQILPVPLLSLFSWDSANENRSIGLQLKRFLSVESVKAAGAIYSYSTGRNALPVLVGHGSGLRIDCKNLRCAVEKP